MRQLACAFMMGTLTFGPIGSRLVTPGNPLDAAGGAGNNQLNSKILMSSAEFPIVIDIA